jgi:hypothetical protein
MNTSRSETIKEKVNVNSGVCLGFTLVLTLDFVLIFICLQIM